MKTKYFENHESLRIKITDNKNRSVSFSLSYSGVRMSGHLNEIGSQLSKNLFSALEKFTSGRGTYGDRMKALVKFSEASTTYENFLQLVK